jgi:hypothetical protein
MEAQLEACTAQQTQITRQHPLPLVDSRRSLEPVDPQALMKLLEEAVVDILLSVDNPYLISKLHPQQAGHPQVISISIICSASLT